MNPNPESFSSSESTESISTEEKNPTTPPEETPSKHSSPEALQDIGKKALQEITTPNSQEFLSLDEAPKDYRTAAEIADELMEELDRSEKIDPSTIRRTAQKLGIFGQIFKGRNGHKTTFYSPKKQVAIKDKLTLEDPPEGWFTKRGLAEELNLTHATIGKYIDKAPPIEGKEYKDKMGRSTPHYSLAEVRERVEHLASVEDPPEDWFSIRELARRLKLSRPTIREAINQDPQIEGKDYKIDDGQLITHYPLSEVTKRVEHLTSAESAPEGWLTINGLMDELDLGDRAIYSAINQDPSIRGKEYKDTNNHLTLHYPLSEVEKRVEHLTSTESAPEGWLTINGLAKKYKLDAGTIRNAMLRAPVEGKDYRTAIGHIRTFYSSEEQAIILEKLGDTTAGTSFPENAIAFYLKQSGLNIQQGIRPDWMKNPDSGYNLEIDIFIPSENPPPPGIGIEYDGVFWHKNPEYDARKNTLAKQQDIEIIHIREQGCPELPKDIMCIDRQDNKDSHALADCIGQCFAMLNIPLPETGIDISRDQSEIYSLMDARGIRNIDTITEEIIEDGVLVVNR